MRHTLVVGVIVMLAAGTALATVPGTDLFVPAVAHGSGYNQALWKTDLWIFNPSKSQTATVTIFLLLRQANPSPVWQQATIGPGDTQYFPDVVGTGLFQQTNAAGGLRITSGLPVLVTAETYNANVTTTLGTGTSGQFFAGIPANWAIGPNQSTDLPGFDQDGVSNSGFHSNLALVETTGNALTYTVQPFDGLGNPMSQPKQYSLQGYEVGQINNVITDLTGGTGHNVRLHIIVTGGSGRLIAAGSRIDNMTGDPSTIDMVGTPNSGSFEGVVFDTTTGTKVDGGLQLAIAGNVLTNFQGIAGIPCGSDSFTLDFSPTAAVTVPVAADGTFTTSVSVQYTDGVNNLFTTNWTLTGARAGNGTWSGTLTSDTSNGVNVGGYDYSTCNALGVTRQWHAAWTGGNS